MSEELKKKIKEAREWLREFISNGTQHYSRMQYFRYFSELLELIENNGGKDE